jgi:hypothetical protein
MLAGFFFSFSRLYFSGKIFFITAESAEIAEKKFCVLCGE